MSADLHDRLARAVGAVGEPDLEVLAARALRRRERRRIAGALGVVAVLGVGAAVFMARPELAPIDSGGVTALRAVDFDAPGASRPGLVALSDEELRHLPTLLPRDYLRCAGPFESADGLLVTVFCTDAGDEIGLATAAHEPLPERGEQVAVGARAGWLDAVDGRRTLTVSDADRLDDLHYRIDAPIALEPDALVRIALSIPALGEAAGVSE